MSKSCIHLEFDNGKTLRVKLPEDEIIKILKNCSENKFEITSTISNYKNQPLAVINYKKINYITVCTSSWCTETI